MPGSSAGREGWHTLSSLLSGASYDCLYSNGLDSSCLDFGKCVNVHSWEYEASNDAGAYLFYHNNEPRFSQQEWYTARKDGMEFPPLRTTDFFGWNRWENQEEGAPVGGISPRVRRGTVWSLALRAGGLEVATEAPAAGLSAEESETDNTKQDTPLGQPNL